MTDLAAQWQRRLDGEFPHGLALSRDYGRPQADSVPVCWVRVTGMHGLDPEVTIYPDGIDRPVWHDVVSSMEELQQSPRLVRVTLANSQHAMLWTALVRTEFMARKLAPWRAYYQAKAAGRPARLPA